MCGKEKQQTEFKILRYSCYQNMNNYPHGQWTKKDLLTQNSEKGLGGLDRHGEERAGVLALIWQADVTDSYGELLPWRSHQLNSVVPQSCIREVKTKNHRVKKKSCWIQWWQFTVEVLLFRWPYAEGGWMHHAFNYLNGCQMPQTHAVANSFK